MLDTGYDIVKEGTQIPNVQENAREPHPVRDPALNCDPDPSSPNLKRQNLINIFEGGGPIDALSKEGLELIDGGAGEDLFHEQLPDWIDYPYRSGSNDGPSEDNLREKNRPDRRFWHLFRLLGSLIMLILTVAIASQFDDYDNSRMFKGHSDPKTPIQGTIILNHEPSDFAKIWVEKQLSGSGHVNSQVTKASSADLEIALFGSTDIVDAKILECRTINSHEGDARVLITFITEDASGTFVGASKILKMSLADAHWSIDGIE